jgi:undecaprenyl diphosphate synthase
MASIKHVAIIMDGNGRWAKERHRPRVWGHIRGSQRVSDIVTTACELNLESLTMYAFSTENWSRPKDEISSLFKILKKFLKKERNAIIKNNIKFDVIGNYHVLNSDVVNMVESLKEETSTNTGLNLSLAINYGGRAEIVNAVNEFLKESNSREMTESDISNHLYNPNIKNIDLVIRTADEQRVSNFLLWELCYAEFFFSETKWPEFGKEEFIQIINKVSSRERRFGNVSSSNETRINLMR